MDRPQPVPDDLAACQEVLSALQGQNDSLQEQLAQRERELAERERQLVERARELDEQRRVLDETAATHEELHQKYEALREELRALRRWAFGTRRERFVEDPGQRHLFDLAPPQTDQTDGFADTTDEDADENEADHTAQQQATRQRRRRERKLNLDALPQIEHHHDVSDEEKVCDCCGHAKECIGEDISRELEFQPAFLEVHVHHRPKYACRCGQSGVISPPLPDRPLDRSIAGPGLLAGLIVGKFGDHLPLYRLEDIFVRYGVHLPRSTLCDWMQASAELLRPLYELQKKFVLASPVLWTDDTPVTFLGDAANPGSHTGRYWTYIGDDEHPYSVYDFTTSRRRDGPAAFLADYSGFVHADAYSGYDGIYLANDGRILEVACHAHARRKFYDARTNQPRECHQILEWYRQLYDIEDRAAELPVAERLALRQLESVPILERLEIFLRTHQATALPKSAFGKAITYALNQWDALCRFTTDGRLTIDNNTAERTLRHQAIGRKNWLFLGSEQAGERGAILSTILAGAKRHRLEPFAYVRDVLLHLHASPADLSPWLPDCWAALHPEHVLQYRLEESRLKATRQRERRASRRRLTPASH